MSARHSLEQRIEIGRRVYEGRRHRGRDGFLRGMTQKQLCEALGRGRMQLWRDLQLYLAHRDTAAESG